MPPLGETGPGLALHVAGFERGLQAPPGALCAQRLQPLHADLLQVELRAPGAQLLHEAADLHVKGMVVGHVQDAAGRVEPAHGVELGTGQGSGGDQGTRAWGKGLMRCSSASLHAPDPGKRPARSLRALR